MTATTTTIAAATRGVATVLEKAAEIGLPMPYNISIYNSVEPDLQFRTLEELTAWSLWADVPIESMDGSTFVRHVVLVDGVRCFTITGSNR